MHRPTELTPRHPVHRLADEGAVTSVGSKGDSYDNALAESVNGLNKTALIRSKSPARPGKRRESAASFQCC